MARSRSSSSGSSGSTSSSSSSSSSASPGRRHKLNSEKRRSHQTQNNKRNNDTSRHDSLRNRRQRSRSNSRQRNYSEGRKDRNRDYSTDKRVDRKRNSSKDKHRKSNADDRQDRRRSLSIDKKRRARRHSSSNDKRRVRKRSSSDDRRRAHKHSSDDRRRARKRSNSGDRRRVRKRSSSDDKMISRKRSTSADSRRRRHSRYSSTDDRQRNRKRNNSDDRRKGRKHSSSIEPVQDRKKSSSVDRKRSRKESGSNDRRNDKNVRNSQSSDRSPTAQPKYRSGSESSIKNRKSMKRKSIDSKGRDESLSKKSKFEELSKKCESKSSSRKSKEEDVIIPSIPCKWDRVDDNSREEESDDLINSDINKENLNLATNKIVPETVNIKNYEGDKSDNESELNKKSLGGKLIKSKIVAEEIMHSSCKERSIKDVALKDTNVECNKFTLNNEKIEANNKEEISIKKSLTKDPISFSIKSIRKDHKKKHIGKESKTKSKEEIFLSGYETDSEGEDKAEKSTKHHKRSRKRTSPLIKSIDSDKIMSESEDELQKMKAQLQKELEIEEELERQEKIKHERTEKLDQVQSLGDNLKINVEVKKNEDLENPSKDCKTLPSKKNEKLKELKKNNSDLKEKLVDTSDIDKKKKDVKSHKEDKIGDLKVSSSDRKEKKKDRLKIHEESNLRDSKSTSTFKEEQKLDKLKNSNEDVGIVTSSSEIEKKKESLQSDEVINIKDNSDKKKENLQSHKEETIKDSGKKLEDASSNLENTKKATPSSDVCDKKREDLKNHKENNLDVSNTSSSRQEDKKKDVGSHSKLLKEVNVENLKSSSLWPGHGSDPILTELPSVSSRQPKTSDTYWNKYADKLGIIIDDPKDSGDNNGNGSKKRKLSPVDANRKKKGREEEITDNVACTVKIDNDASIVSQNEVKVVSTPSLKKPVMDPISSRTGGAYIPPARLKMMQDQITDKSSAAYQRLAWEALKKSINGLVNKINVSNIGIIVRELFKENIVRGRGLLCRALMQAQAFSPTFTHVYAALVAVINTKFPQIGELLLHRLVLQLRRGVKRNDKNSCIASCRFIGHLINQQVAHEVVALEILTMLLEKAKDLTDETEVGDKSRKASVELAIAFLKDCGMKLSELTPKGLMIVMETLRNILHEGKLDSRFQYMVEVLMAIKKGGFKDYPAVIEELDLVEEEDQFTHVIELDGKLDTQEMLNVFKLDPDYEENEAKYKELKSSILGDESGDESGGDGSSESGAESDDEESEDEKGEDGTLIIDRSEANLVEFRRTVYLTIQSSLDVDECAHKLLKGEIKPGWEEELCNMIIDCCAQQRTYMKFYGLLAQRFCMLNKIYQKYFEKIFKDAYETCHRLEIEKLRNVAKLFSHLFFSDAISWESFSCIHLNQDETTSSSRVFLKILFEELGDFMGLGKLNERLRDPTLAPSYEGLLPRDNPVNTRFAINFFTTIGLGGLTDDLREFLRNQPKPTAVVAPVPQTSKDESSNSSSSSSDSSSDDSSTSSDSSSSSSSSEDSSSDSVSSSDSSSSDSSFSESSYSDSSSSEDSSSEDSYKKSSSLKNKKKLLKKLQMEQRRASRKKHGPKDKKKLRDEKHAKDENRKVQKHKNVDEGKSRKMSKNEKNHLVFENKKVEEKNFDRRKNKNNSECNINRNDSSSDGSSDNTRGRKSGGSSKNTRSKIEENKEKQHERCKDVVSRKRKSEHSSDREERNRSRPPSREKSNESPGKSRKSKDERNSRNNNENNKEKELEVEPKSRISEKSESSEGEEKVSKKSSNRDKETEKNRNKRENANKEDRKDKRKDLKNDEKMREKRREKDDSDKEDESESQRRRRNREKDNKEYESKSKGSRDKDREKKEDRRARRLSQI